MIKPFTILTCMILMTTSSCDSTVNNPENPQTNNIAEPVLKWAYGGCTTFCKTGWYSSPAVADLDNDGRAEIIAANFDLVVLNGEDGSIQWNKPMSNRVWPGVVVSDVDNDTNQDLEIVVANSGSLLAYDHAGNLLWETNISTSEIRSLSAYDIDNDNTAEIIAGAAISSAEATWVLEHNGVLRTGWPQQATGSWGIFNNNITIADMNKDNIAEIYIPNDTHNILAFNPDGSAIAANTLYGPSETWNSVSTYETLSDELQGFPDCAATRPYRSNFSGSPAVVADLNNDAEYELSIIGKTEDACAMGIPLQINNGAYIFNSDRSRFNSGSYNWQLPPLDITDSPLSLDSLVIENNFTNPVVADLDNDGEKEILFSSYDGKLHALWLDKTEHGNWPYSVNNVIDGFFRLSGEPVVVDLDNNGSPEIIVASWTEVDSGAEGKIHILDNLGNLIHEKTIPAALVTPAGNWNGTLATPTLANVDDDNDLELVLNTAYSGVVVFDLPNSASANIIWSTGRGNYQRTGFIP